MAGGDMRVIRQDPVGNSFGSPAIDCNSTRSGNMTVPMEVDGKTAWFTPQGAAAYAQLQAENAFLGSPNKLKLESDPSFLSRFFFGDPRSEQCLGQP